LESGTASRRRAKWVRQGSFTVPVDQTRHPVRVSVWRLLSGRAEGSGVMADVILHEGGDEVVTVVVALMMPER
jgi:hypothetical protein